LSADDDGDFWKALKLRLSQEKLPLVAVRLTDMALDEQARIVTRANVFISSSSGPSSVAVHFMPRNTAAVFINKYDLNKNYGYLGGLGYVRPFFLKEGAVDDVVRLIVFQFHVSERMRVL